MTLDELGVVTFAEIADEIGVDERTVRRVIEGVAKRFHDAGIRDLTLAEMTFFSSEVAAFLRVPRRFRQTRDQEGVYALPRRFRSKPR